MEQINRREKLEQINMLTQIFSKIYHNFVRHTAPDVSLSLAVEEFNLLCPENYTVRLKNKELIFIKPAIVYKEKIDNIIN